MSTTNSLSEVVNKARALPTKEEKVAWLKAHNSQALRTIMSVMYDPEKFVWNIPNDVAPPYTPSPHVESHGMLYRQTRKLRYFITGFDGDRLHKVRREFLFIELLESIDKDDAELMVKVLLQKPFKELSSDVLNEGLGLQLPLSLEPTEETPAPKKRGRKPKNG